jgi:glycosyltransferase involved in cell wall biosynthesis
VDNDAFEAWATASDREKIRKDYGLFGTVFVTVSALVPRKGIDHLIEAWAGMNADLRRQASLLIAGDGPERERLESMVEARGLQGVVFAGRLEPPLVAACLGASDVFVFPTLEDVWGLAVNEAMVAGLPVLCSRYAGCAEDLVRPGENGAHVDPLDTAQFTCAIEEMIRHPERGQSMGRRSKHIISGFTVARSVTAMTNLFENYLHAN